MSAENVHKGHRQRLRERALREGFDSFNPHQVIELLLFYALPRKDTSELAHMLVDRFGTVHGVLNAPEEELVKISGVGSRTAQWLNKVGEMISACAELRDTDRIVLRTCSEVMRFCRAKSDKLTRPQTCCIVLTPAGAVQAFEKLCDSTAWVNPEPLKRCLNTVLRLYARHVVVVEFCGEAYPSVSEDEIRCSCSFAQTLTAMNAELLDVVLMGTDGAVSLRMEGHLPKHDGKKEWSLLSECYLMEPDPDSRSGVTLEEALGMTEFRYDE